MKTLIALTFIVIVVFGYALGKFLQSIISLARDDAVEIRYPSRIQSSEKSDPVEMYEEPEYPDDFNPKG